MGAWIAACAVTALFAQVARAQAQAPTPGAQAARAKAQNVAEIPFDSVPNPLKWPANIYLGEGIGVATNSKGHVFVYTRSQRTRLFEFDAKGNYLREIGEGLYGFVFAHAVRVDAADKLPSVLAAALEHIASKRTLALVEIRVRPA